jgi:hypothetical protein
LEAKSPQWIASVYVEDGTNKIISIGKPPANRKGTTDCDMIRVKAGYQPKVGEILDHTRIEDLYDVKTPLEGEIKGGQRVRLRNVINGWKPGDRSIKSAMTPRRYTVALQWHANTRYVNGLKLFSIIGIATSVWAIFNHVDLEPQFQACVREAVRIQKTTDPVLKKSLAQAWLLGEVKTYISNFIPDDTILTLGLLPAVYVAIDEIR